MTLHLCEPFVELSNAADSDALWASTSPLAGVRPNADINGSGGALTSPSASAANLFKKFPVPIGGAGSVLRWAYWARQGTNPAIVQVGLVPVGGGIGASTRGPHTDHRTSGQTFRCYTRAEGGVVASNYAVSPTGTVGRAYNFFEVEYRPAVSGGAMRVWMNGNLIVDYSGPTATEASVGTLFEGISVSLGGASAVADTGCLDDLLVWDDAGTDFTGTIGIVTLTPFAPNAAGDRSEGVGSTAGAKFSLVNELAGIAADTSYVDLAGVGVGELYNVADLTQDATIVGVVSRGYVKAAPVGEGSVRSIVKVAGAESKSPAQSILGAGIFTPVHAVRRKPDGSAWSVTDFNAVQIGIEKAS